MLLSLVSLVDDFNDNSKDGAKWTTDAIYQVAYTVAGTTAETNQECEVSPPASTAGLNGTGFVSATFDLTGKAIYVKVPSRLSSGSNRWSGVHVGTGVSQHVGFTINEDGTFIVNGREPSGPSNIADTGTATAFSAGMWFCIREQSGTLYFYTAPASATSEDDFTLYATLANPFAVTALRLNLWAGTFASVASPGTAKYDNVNTGLASGSAGSPAPKLIRATAMAMW